MEIIRMQQKKKIHEYYNRRENALRKAFFCLHSWMFHSFHLHLLQSRTHRRLRSGGASGDSEVQTPAQSRVNNSRFLRVFNISRFGGSIRSLGNELQYLTTVRVERVFFWSLNGIPCISVWDPCFVSFQRLVYSIVVQHCERKIQ